MKPNFGLSQEQIEHLSKELYRLLSNTFALYVATLSSHWNIEDPRFYSLHKMLEKQYEALAENCDVIAERIRMMGKKVSASLKKFENASEMEDIEEIITSDQMLERLAVSHEKLIKDIRELSQIAEEYGDAGLTDMLGTLVRFHEKTTWFIRSHL
ncbi:MAG: Dps family protein [Chlamydiales bacterium]